MRLVDLRSSHQPDLLASQPPAKQTAPDGSQTVIQSYVGGVGRLKPPSMAHSYRAGMPVRGAQRCARRACDMQQTLATLALFPDPPRSSFHAQP